MAAPEAPLLYQGVPRSSAAFRLLKLMGWQEGEGLGKEKQGITEHVRVSTKKDNSGVGVDAQQRAASNWTFNTSTFDNILKNLKVIAAESEKEDKIQEGPTAGISCENKQQSKKATRPQGRYKNREFGKVLKGKSQADLDAILGYCSRQSDKIPVVEVRSHLKHATAARLIADSDSDSGLQAPDRLAEGNQVFPIEQCSLAGYTEEGAASEWWGVKYGFVRGGLLGSRAADRNTKTERSSSTKANEGDSKCRSAFCEEDQENLYKLVQDKATKGRQGLGIGDRPKKIGGAHWKGQKVILDGDDDNDDNCTDDSSHKRKAHSRFDSEEKGKMKYKMPKCEDKDVRKWKSMCRILLQEVPAQTMSIKRLHKRIIGACDLFPCSHSPDNNEQAVQLLKEKLSSSSKFVITGKRVSLADSNA